MFAVVVIGTLTGRQLALSSLTLGVDFGASPFDFRTLKELRFHTILFVSGGVSF